MDPCGEAIALAVLAGAMHADGFSFRRADNGVWLTAEVPTRFLRCSVEGE